MSSCALNSLPESDIYSHLTGNCLILCEACCEFKAACSHKKKKARYFTSVFDQARENKLTKRFCSCLQNIFDKFYKYIVWSVERVATHTYIYMYTYSLSIYDWINISNCISGWNLPQILNNAWVNVCEVITQCLWVYSCMMRLWNRNIGRWWLCMWIMSLEKGKLGRTKPWLALTNTWSKTASLLLGLSHWGEKTKQWG